jgi:hypothetical protein
VISTDDRPTTESSPSAAVAVAAGRSNVSSTHAPQLLSEFERLLTEPGCPACRHIAETERSFFSWFEIESHTSSEMQAGLRAAMGMCPCHTRRLVEALGAGHVMTIVMREALSGARRVIREEIKLGPCPACEAIEFGAGRARTLLIDSLQDPALARRYSGHGGVCLVHLVDALPVAEPATLKLLAERLLESLHDVADSALVDLLAGVDADGPRRAVFREGLPVVPHAHSTVERLVGQLATDACPVCLAAGVAGRDYLAWFLAGSEADDRSLDSDPGELCSTHLHDVAHAASSQVDNPAVQRKRSIRVAQLERFLARLAEMPPTERQRRRSNHDALASIREELATRPYCPACHAREGVERAQRDLITASLALTTVRERYEHAHGLCVRHAMRVADGSASRVARQHADARLATIAWEVQETSRKYAWAFRHESSGFEQDGWLRGMAQIDGRVFDGAPAPIRYDDAEDGPRGAEQR